MDKIAIAYYGSRLSPHMDITPEGFLICRDVPIARTGVQEYLAQELGLDGDPHRVVTVNRYPEDVFEPATLASFEGKAVTDDHPPENVGPENFSNYSKGHVQNVRRNGEYIVADFFINDATLISEIQHNVKREVSCGYLCNYEPDGAGYKQSHIRGNHVAVVQKGRAGAAVAIQDSAAVAEKGKNRMNNFMKLFLRAFGTAAKDAAPEELDQMVETTATVLAAGTALDAEPAAKAQDADPAESEGAAADDAAAADAADVEVERAPKGDDLGSKLDTLIEMVKELRGHAEPEAKKISDTCDLDDAIAKADSAADGAASTIEPDETGGAAAGDSAAYVKILKKLRPAVAAIPDAQARARVVDALLSANDSADKVGDIMQAAQDSAQKNADAAKRTDYEKLCADAEAAYASRNPHKNKEA